MFLLLWVVAISIILIIIIVCYYRKVSWQMTLLTFRLNRIIRCPQRNKRTVQRLLKHFYSILNRSIAINDSVTAYRIIDLLKLSYGSGLMRQDEAARLMAITVSALNNGNPDIAGFILDAFRPLIRQLAPQFIPRVAEHLTLISAVALKQKQSFLVVKVAECIFFIMERSDAALDKNILEATIKALKVIGVIGLRRHDVSLFREITVRLSIWFATHPITEDVTEEIVNMLTAWLYRIVRMDEIVPFDLIEECVYSLIEAKLLSGNSMEYLFVEWGNLAASACLNPNSPLAGRILNFLFIVIEKEGSYRHLVQVVTIAGRVGKLAVSCHGITVAFMVFYPMLEMGRKLLWSELRFTQCVDEYRQEMLFTIVRECLVVIAFASRQELVGSSGQSIVDIYNCWIKNADITTNAKSVKKYCQFLLFFMLKDKRQAKKYMPYDSGLTEPILFSDAEKHRFGIKFTTK